MAKGKILVVDDEKIIREGFTKVLGNEGYEVYTAKDERECLEAFKKGVFNLVMMDIKLPEADGVELLNKLKVMDPEIEVVIITGYASLESAIEALRFGAGEYITKPFDRDEDVVMVVNRLVEKQKLAVENKNLQNEIAVQLVQSGKLSILGELAAGIAHELNQPLNNIKIICQSILMDIQKDRYNKEDLEPDLRAIVKEVDKMGEIIGYMKIFSRRTIGMTKEEIDLNILIEGILKFIGQQLRDANIEVIKQLTPGLPKPIGDPVRLEQVILNLITNAKNSVENSCKKDKRIEIKTYKMEKEKSSIKRPAVVVEVTDNGLGIPKDLRGKIFEPFFTTKKPGEGIGLGLSVAHKIIEEQEGKIELESKVDEGTIFRVILPVTESKAGY